MVDDTKDQYLWPRHTFLSFETQFLIVEGQDDSDFGEERGEQSALYVVFLPILEGDFRAVLQGNENDELEICLESVDPAVQEFDGSHLVFIAAGSDPFDVITNAVKAVERHLPMFSHHDRKKMPDMLKWFGWCTWDAFYTDVTAEGVKQGLESFESGGISHKFIIIDDGWQSVGMDLTSTETKADDSANFSQIDSYQREPHISKEWERWPKGGGSINGNSTHCFTNQRQTFCQICLYIACNYWILGWCQTWHCRNGAL